VKKQFHLQIFRTSYIVSPEDGPWLFGGHMETATRGLHVSITLLGVFRLENADGSGIPVKSKKARALIGLLALSKNGERSRVWLQNMLWCRCGRTEAQSSLRRELSTLRSVLEASGCDILEVARDSVRLKLENCHVDALDGCGTAMSQLLEGIDLPGEEEFEDWLRGMRASPLPASASVAAATSLQAKSPVAASEDNRLTVQIRLEALHDGTPLADFLPEMLRQQVFAGLDETGYFRAAASSINSANQSHAEPDISLWIKTTHSGGALGLIMFANVATSQTLLFSLQDVIPVERNSWEQAARRIREIAAGCVDRMVRKCVANDAFGGESHRARKALLTAVDQMFSLNAEQVTSSRHTLAHAAGIENLAVFHAWKAYQANFLHDRAHQYDFRITLEECRENISRALEADAHSGVALALCAHVEAFLFQDLAAAGDLIERAGATGTRHVMYFDSLALFRFYIGDYQNAREAAHLAAAAGQHLPFRYCFSTTLCMIEAMSGNFESAIAFGRRARVQEPRRKSISYPPTLRYLGASLALNGAASEARQVFATLGSTNRSIDLAELAAGHVTGHGCAQFIRAGLDAAGL
jgi:hypothetical protein